MPSSWRRPGEAGRTRPRRVARRSSTDRRGSAADATVLQASLRTLVNFSTVNQFGRQKIEAECTALIVAGECAAIDQHVVERRSKAAHGDEPAFTAAAIDRNARNTLERFGNVCVGEFAKVFGADGIKNTVRIALDASRTAQAAARRRRGRQVQRGRTRCDSAHRRWCLSGARPLDADLLHGDV